MTVSFMMSQCKPVNQPVTGIFDQIFTILGPENGGKRCTEAGLGFIEQDVREVERATVSQLESLSMGQLMCQAGKGGQPGIGVDSIPRDRISTQKDRILYLIETRPRAILDGC
jgi:hypothetical protein